MKVLRSLEAAFGVRRLAGTRTSSKRHVVGGRVPAGEFQFFVLVRMHDVSSSVGVATTCDMPMTVLVHV